MGRKAKNNATWFRLDWDTHNHRKIKVIRAKYGIEGYAVYILLLQLLTHADSTEYADDSTEIMLLAADWGTTPEVVRGVLDIAYELRLFELTDDGYFFAERLKENVAELNNKRDRDRMRYENQKVFPPAEIPFSPISANGNAISEGGNPTDKIRLDKIRLEERREEKRGKDFSPSRISGQNGEQDEVEKILSNGPYPVFTDKPANDGSWHEQEFLVLVIAAWRSIQIAGRAAAHEEKRLKDLWLEYNTEKMLWGIGVLGDRKQDARTIINLSRYLTGEYSTAPPKSAITQREENLVRPKPKPYVELKQTPAEREAARLAMQQAVKEVKGQLTQTSE